MSDLITKKIKIKEIEQKIMNFKTPNNEEIRKVFIKTDDGMKLKFYSHKKDGSKTVAYKAFESGKIGKGTEVDIGFSEEEKTFTPTDGKNKGKEVKYMDRWLSFFDNVSDLEEGVQLEPAGEEEINVDEIPF